MSSKNFNSKFVDWIIVKITFITITLYMSVAKTGKKHENVVPGRAVSRDV